MRICGLLILLVGCGSSGASDYGSFQQQGRKLICQNGVDCGRLDPAYESACEQSFGAAAMPDPSTYSFDSGAASGCLAAFKQALSSCGRVSLGDMMITAACKSVITGKTPAGGSCPFGVECAPGSRCIVSFANVSCTSKCVALGNLGDPCDSGGSCVDGAYCDLQTKRCKAQLDSGATCTGSLDCKSGLYCVGAMTRSCAAPGGSGAACAPFEQQSCTGDLICDSASSSCAVAKQMGQACSGDSECANPLVCFRPPGTGAVGNCLPLAAKGASCTAARCIAPYLCTNGTCTVPPDIGEACTTTCLHGYCSTTSQKCEAQNAVGSACEPGAPSCVGPAYCDATSKTCKLCQ